MRKLSWIVLSVAILAILLTAAACGGGNGNGGTTPEATSGSPDTTGVTATEVKWGTTFPLSGNPAAAYAPISYGMDAMFKYVNAQGGVYGRKLTLVIGDDHYSPADTVEVTRQLVEGDKIFGLIGNLGDATQLAVYKYLEEKGVPNMFLSTGLAVWTHPIVKSRFGGNPDYITEGMFLGQYIVKNYPGKKVGFLLQNDELGADGETGLKKGLEGSDVKIVATEKYEAIQSDVSAQTQRHQLQRHLHRPGHSAGRGGHNQLHLRSPGLRDRASRRPEVRKDLGEVRERRPAEQLRVVWHIRG